MTLPSLFSKCEQNQEVGGIESEYYSYNLYTPLSGGIIAVAFCCITHILGQRQPKKSLSPD